MQKLPRENPVPDFVPDYIASSLLAIDFEALKKAGIRHIAFDADSTLVPFRGRVLSEEVKLFLQKNRQLFDSWCIASNSITNDLLPLGESMDAVVFRASWLVRKPQKRFFRQVIQHFGVPPHQIAMIGDKLLADIWGGKRSDMTTVWVERIGADSPWDRLIRLRYWEKRLLQRYIGQKLS
jgi:HAD superfamily phosphatase (TIGR01668 family)